MDWLFEASDPDNNGYVGLNFPMPSLVKMFKGFVAAVAKANDIAMDDIKLETEPHITLRYGLHRDISADRVKQRLARFDGPVNVTFGPQKVFEGPGRPDVVYVSVPNAGLLAFIHESLRVLPGIRTHQQYVPHMTVAYVPTGKGHLFTKFPLLQGVTLNSNDITFNQVGQDGPSVKMALPHLSLESCRLAIGIRHYLQESYFKPVRVRRTEPRLKYMPTGLFAEPPKTKDEARADTMIHVAMRVFDWTPLMVGNAVIGEVVLGDFVTDLLAKNQTLPPQEQVRHEVLLQRVQSLFRRLMVSIPQSLRRFRPRLTVRKKRG